MVKKRSTKISEPTCSRFHWLLIKLGHLEQFLVVDKKCFLQQILSFEAKLLESIENEETLCPPTLSRP